MKRSALSAAVGIAMGAAGALSLQPDPTVEVPALNTVRIFSEVYAFDGSWHPLQLPDGTAIYESFIKTTVRDGKEYALAFWPLDIAELSMIPTHVIEITNRNDPAWPADRWVSYQPVNLEPIRRGHIWVMGTPLADGTIDTILAWDTRGPCESDTTLVETRIFDTGNR